jgi:hypothetical protein
MNKFIIFLFVLFVTGASSIYGEPMENDTVNTEQNKNTPKTFYMPLLSYTSISFDDIQAHNAVGGLMLFRFNPHDRDKLFAVSLIYAPQILTNTAFDFPNWYHTAAVSITQKINRHTINGAFIALTDKPVYGGLRTFMGLAGYSYNLIKGAHFSMDIGGHLAVMDFGLRLDNGMPWLLWPVPSINLSWKYEWITFGLMPGVRMSIGPEFPVGFVVKAGLRKYDASLWYRYFKNGTSSSEILGMGIGIKRDSSDVMRYDGWKYGIHYDALYGTFRIVRLFEISGGWVFSGKEGYEKVNWETLFESNGYSNDTMYNRNIGKGFFVSLSVRMNM